MNRNLILHLAVVWLASGALFGCGDDDGMTVVDAGRDAGPGVDSGPEIDAGCTPVCEGRECGDDGCGGTCGECPAGVACGDDFTCSQAFFSRLALLVPNVAAGQLCIGVVAGGSVVTTVGPLPGLGTAGFPFRGVSGYNSLFEATPGVEYAIRLYAASDLEAFGSCPAEGDAGAPEPVASGSVDASALEPGGVYTFAIVGLADEAGARPSYCGATLDAPCTDESTVAHVVVLEDDTEPVAASTKVRLYHAIPNLPTPMGVDVCHDPDPADDAVPVVEIFENIAYDEASVYIETDPMVAGELTIHAHVDAATDCPGTAVPAALLATIPLPYPEPIGTAMAPGTVADFPAGQVATIFASGRAGGDAAPAGPGPAFIPFADALPSM